MIISPLVVFMKLLIISKIAIQRTSQQERPRNEQVPLLKVRQKEKRGDQDYRNICRDPMGLADE